VSNPATLRDREMPRHRAVVRATHWITVVCFLALLVSGLELVVSHPRFYWGETGNSGTTPLFSLHIPASRETVPTGYKYVLPDQNGWSRYLHFQAAWVLLITGAVYVIFGVWSGHFRRDLIPARGERNGSAFRGVIGRYVRRAPPDPEASQTYNVMQRASYLGVIFVLFPLIIWTGLAMSPAFDAVVPAAVDVLGGRQSARTLHFFVTWLLVFFLVVHVAMVIHAGFRSRMRAMTTGGSEEPEEVPGQSPNHTASEEAA
jgi:thiosulfate reductase cytochrome b subunit